MTRRDELAWALTAVLPHAGTQPALSVVGIAAGLRGTFLYATDRYTIGVARLNGDLPSVTLPKREATELLRFIRPGKVAEQSEEVEAVSAEDGLHVAIQSESAVFDIDREPAFTFDTITNRLQVLEALPKHYERLEYTPDFTTRFAKAKRDPEDRLRLYPRKANDFEGVAIVTVGNDFLGAIGGLKRDSFKPESVAGFLGFVGEEVA